MRTGRKKKLDRPKPFKVYIPESLKNAVQDQLSSESYGAQSRLVERLLREWLETKPPIPEAPSLDDFLEE